MKVDAFLLQATKTLTAAGISTARLDCLVLLEDILNTNRILILAEPDNDLTEADHNKLAELIQKRAQHIPLAYLRGRTEFYGREFIVNKYVLEPRPESETMIELCKTLHLGGPTVVADIGTGSGALGITVALELPQVDTVLLDINSAALVVAKQNAVLHNIRTRLLQNDLLAGITEHFDVLLCNLPYVPDDFNINTAAGHEPANAIFGGADGLDLYRRLFTQLSDWSAKPSHVLTESLPPQHPALIQIAHAAGFRLSREDDFILLFQPV